MSIPVVSCKTLVLPSCHVARRALLMFRMSKLFRQSKCCAVFTDWPYSSISTSCLLSKYCWKKLSPNEYLDKFENNDSLEVRIMSGTCVMEILQPTQFENVICSLMTKSWRWTRTIQSLLPKALFAWFFSFLTKIFYISKFLLLFKLNSKTGRRFKKKIPIF